MHDCFVDGFYSIYDEAGTPIASTYFGGNGVDGLGAVANSGTGRLLVTGASGSGDLYVSPNAYQPSPAGGFDSLLLELDPATGDVVYSSYLGGSNNDSALEITADGSENVYLVGTSASIDYPTAGGGSESPIASIGATVTKLNPQLSQILFSTFYASPSTDFVTGEAIAVNVQGDIAIVGQVARADWFDGVNQLTELDDPNFSPTSFEDGHVIKWLNQGGRYELDYASLFGGQGAGQAVDLRGRETVLIGGLVAGNPYLDSTYHYNAGDPPGSSDGAFAMVIENDVAANPSGGGGSGGGSGGGGALSLVFLLWMSMLTPFRVLVAQRSM